jgi:hypothetical protein
MFNQDLYEERAAFLQYCEGLTKEEAEKIALAEQVQK